MGALKLRREDDGRTNYERHCIIHELGGPEVQRRIQAHGAWGENSPAHVAMFTLHSRGDHASNFFHVDAHKF